ncbi:MAG: ribonuclease HIII [Ignavibacteriaceae bacterium]|nr:ribonuclease HIII [Ignavibacteriaceae bacterium]
MLSNLKLKAFSRIQEIYTQLASQGLKISNIEEKQHNYELNVQNFKEKVKVLVYFGKKGVSTIIQGDIHCETYIKVKKVAVGEGLFDSIGEKISEPEEYIGTDESGKGDFFGPLVIAAVYADQITLNELKQIGVKDSKQLTDEQIKIISKQIRKIIPENFRNVVAINPEKYNQLYDSFKNLNKLLAWGHSKAIENIFLKNNATTAISDKFGDEGLIISELAKKKIDINLIQTTKAERFTAVAAASILARDKMLNWFTKTTKELKFEIPKGAGDVVNITLDKIASKNGTEFLSKLVKLHFKNYVNYSNLKKG